MSISTRPPQAAPRDRGGQAGRTSPTRGHRRGLLGGKRLLVLIAAPLLVAGLAACEPNPQQESVRSRINASREAQGVHPLGDDVAVRIKAQDWAEHLASTGRLSHSDLSAGLDAVSWVAVAENVGSGASIEAVHDQFMRSPRHRANILDHRWDRVGTGHAVGRDGTVYTVQVFVDLG